MSRFSVQRNIFGYADGIGIDGYTVLHLVPGTTRNQHNAQKIVDWLNGLVATVDELEEEPPSDSL